MTEFRPLAPSDVESVLGLMRGYYADDRLPFDGAIAREGLDALAAGEALGRLWLIENDGAVAGYVCITFGFSLEVGGGDFFLEELYVVPAMRRRGIATDAVEFAESQAKEMGARRLCLEVTGHNAAAEAMYERVGYRRHERGLMSKRL